VVIDKWRGYSPIAKAFDLTQMDYNKGLNFEALYTIIHQVNLG